MAFNEDFIFLSEAKKRKTTRSVGFTLVELLVVISILAILGVVAIAAINPVAILSKTRDNRRKADLKLIQPTLEMYYGQKRTYPVYSATPANDAVTFGSQLTDGTVVYLKALPQDPTTGWGYCYRLDSASSYTMCAGVEDASNVLVPSGVTTCTPTFSGTKAGDYCVTNPF